MQKMRFIVGIKLISLLLSPFVGILAIHIIRNITKTTTPIRRYGAMSTERSDCFKTSNSVSVRVARSAVLNGLSLACIKFMATYIPAREPIGLNDCARLSLRVEDSSGPIVRIYGLALVSRNDNPQVRIK